MPVSKQIRGTETAWANSTLILESGQLGYDMTNNILKMGNGVDLWNDLPFVNDNRSTKMYHTVQDVIYDKNNVFVGNIISTVGYDNIDDKGGALYKIVETKVDTWDIEITPSKFMNLINKDYVNYKMFGAILDGVADDEIPIQNAHKYGNKYKVLVKNNFGIIYKKTPTQIPVEYDVDLNGSTIRVRNDNIDYVSWYRIGNLANNFMNYPLTPSQKAQLLEGTSYFEMTDNSLPSNCVVKLKETNYFSREDNGTVYNVERSELMVHDMHGICSGSLIEDWTNAGGQTLTDANNVNYTTVFTSTYTLIPAQTLTFIGCDVDIDTAANVYINVINICRHNVVVKNFTIRPHRNSLRNNDQYKNAVFYVQDSYDVTLENINGFNIAGRNNGSIISTSGYIIRLSCCYNVTIRNCRLNGYWGATSGENLKDIRYENTEANRIDIHNYFRNLFIDKCTLQQRSVQIGYGKGLVSIDNTTVSFNKILDYSMAANVISLNTTYGRPFSGLITINNMVINSNHDLQDVQLIHTELSPNGRSLSPIFYMLPDVSVNNLYCKNNVQGRHLVLLSFNGTTPPEITLQSQKLHMDSIQFNGIKSKVVGGLSIGTELVKDTTINCNNFYSATSTIISLYNVEFALFGNNSLINSWFGSTTDLPTIKREFVVNVIDSGNISI